MDSTVHREPGLKRWLLLRWESLLVAVGGGFGAFLLMASPTQLRHGAALGAGLLCACTAGLMRALGTLDAPTGEVVPASETWLGRRPGEARLLSPMIALPLAFALFVLGALVLGGGALPWVSVLCLLLLAPAAMRRPGLLVFVVCGAIYLPLLGVFGLWDPWETHYGEVAREVLSRDDWISLWWAQDRWFWSKPIYIFWSEALLWSASGIDFRPDSNFQHAEWVLRLPIFAVAIGALVALYNAVARIFRPRAGVLCALVLATTPYFGFLSRQAITDMPFVGNMTIAIALWLMALSEDPEREVRNYRFGRVVLSAQHAVLGLFLLLTLPQVLYLMSRNVTFVGGLFAWHGDEFLYGSPGNAAVPGNFGLDNHQPRMQGLFAQPVALSAYFGACIAVVVKLLRHERRAQSLYMFAFYIFCALAFMAKGIPGFALPGLIALLYLMVWKRWPLLLAGRLRVAAGALTLATVGLPWFVAMYMRHGRAFTNRLLIHDHINRLTTGVHGDTGDIHYFIAQFGYGMFPWIALAPGALGGFLLLRSRATTASTSEQESARRQHQRELIGVMGLWFCAAFTLFSAMTTKFHHYIFPAVPAACVLIGLLLDDLFGAESRPADGTPRALRWAPLSLALLAPVPLLLGVAGIFGDVRGVIPEAVESAQRALWAVRHPWPLWLCVALIALGLGALFGSRVLERGRELESPPDRAGRPTDRALAVALVSGAAIAAFVGRDLSWTTAERPAGMEHLVQLFIYKYERPFPSHLDYRALFTGFSIVLLGLLLLAALPRARRVASRALLGLGLSFSVFCVDVYMMDLSPHWGQRELVERYYHVRRSADEPLVAWQMNWKGENFYTGNHVAVFVDLDNKKVKEWIDRNEGTRAYFLLEHTRLGRFERMVAPRKVKKLSTERDNNKFVLVEVDL